LEDNMDFSVCIDAVFREMDRTVALEKVKEAGYSTFEFWSWWEGDMAALAAKAKALSLDCRGFCTRYFSLSDPGRRETWLEGLKESIGMAKKMGTKFLISQGGDDTGARWDFQYNSVLTGLRAGAELLQEAGITLLLEPVNNKHNYPWKTWLDSSGEGFSLIKEVGSPNIRLLFDIYHQQISEGDILRRLEANIGLVGHIHCAGNPERHEIYQGELNYAFIFKELARMAYRGSVGLEYFPSEDPVAGLKKIKNMIP
jgi:hydroxypyruvate isomerase